MIVQSQYTVKLSYNTSSLITVITVTVLNKAMLFFMCVFSGVILFMLHVTIYITVSLDWTIRIGCAASVIAFSEIRPTIEVLAEEDLPPSAFHRF